MKKILVFGLVLTLALAMAVPVFAAVDINAVKTAIVVDGNRDDAYGDESVGIAAIRDGDVSPSATGTGWAAWDDNNLYFYVEVNDSTPFYNNANPWETDSVEIFIDWNSTAGDDTGNDGNPFWQIRLHAAPNGELDGEQVSGGGNFVDMGGDYSAIPFAARIFNGGYAVEAAMPIALTPGSTPLKEGATVKIAFQINDNQEDAGRTSMAFIVADEDTGNEWQWPHALRGVLALKGAPPAPVVEEAAAVEEVVEPAAVEAAPAPVVAAPAPAPATGNAAIIIFAVALIGSCVLSSRIIKTRA